MRLLPFLVLLTLPIAAQTAGKLEPFTTKGDVGEPALAGSTKFDMAGNAFRITGAGANIWAKADQFQYLWREISGDATLAASIHFEGQGADHRKACLMFRHGMETDAPYVDAVLHGNGLTALQWRNAKGEMTNGVHFPINAPARLRIERKGNVFTIFAAAKEGAELHELGSTQVALGNPVNIGLAVSAHKADVRETAVFSDVKLDVAK